MATFLANETKTGPAEQVQIMFPLKDNDSN